MFHIFQTGLIDLTTIFNRISIISKNIFLSSYSLSFIPSPFLSTDYLLEITDIQSSQISCFFSLLFTYLGEYF